MNTYRVLSALVVFALLASNVSIVATADAPVEKAVQGAARETLEVESALPLYVPGEVIVKLRGNAALVQKSGQPVRANLPSLNAALTQIGARHSTCLFPGADAPDLARIYRLQLDADEDVAQAVAALSADPNVVYAEPNYIARPTSNPSTMLRTSLQSPSSNLQIPNDPLFPQQWGLAKINAASAWDVVTGTQTVVIAVVDSGIDLTHPDLASRLWVNPGEIPANGLDDDNNGYVDDVNGWDFANDDNNPGDDQGHGTQVAGVAAAAANNAVGIAGLCWNCRLMPVKVMQASGVANYSDIADGVLYAAQKGAKVINLSVGGYSHSTMLHTAIQAAVNTYGALVVGGAGNDNTSVLFYPAAYAEALAVAGTASDDIKSTISNYGDWVDVSAPAVAITTTFMGGDYGAGNGTSFAASFVSGLAGLVRAQHPDWNPALVRAQIIHTADPIDTQNPGYAGKLGSGRINAANAVAQPPHPILAIASTAVNGDPLGRPTPGVGATLAVALRNDWLGASGVTGALTTADPYVTIVNGAASFGNIAVGGASTGSPVYSFTVASGAGYNHPIPFTLAVMANGGAYTTAIPLTITTRSGNEIVGGTVLTHTTWTSDKTYIVNSNVNVMPGITLTIQAGAVVKFNSDYNLNVGGALIADGTEPQPIRFMSNTGNAWGRIYFDDSSVDARADISGTYLGGNVLRYVQIESAAQGIGCNNATPYLGYVISDGGGMICAGGDTALWVQDSDLSGDVQISAGSGVDSILGTWVARAPMPTARGELAAAATPNGKIYAIGGEYYSPRATVEEYGPATDTWTARAPMPTARRSLGAAAAPNGKIYAIGGVNWNVGGYLATVEEYDSVTDTWTARAPMPTARSNFAAAAAPSGKIYAIGGYTGSENLATVEEYDPATDTWTARAPMPTARHSLAAVTAPNDKIYAIGGRNSYSADLATVEEYDPATDTWTARAPMPTVRYSLAAVTAPNGKIYAIGGWNSYSANLATVEEYDPVTDTWTARAPMPTVRYSLAAAAAPNGKIYAIGGENWGIGGYLATVEEFTLPWEEYGYHILRSTLRGGLGLPDNAEVQDSTVSGGLSAGSGSLVQNTTAGCINAGSGATVRANDVRRGGISAGSGSTVRGNNVENASGWGIQASGNASVEYNRLVDCADGIQTSGGLVQGNLVANTLGVGLEINGNTSIISNTFTGNAGSAIKIVSATSSTLQITGNNLEFNTGQYDIENLVPRATLANISAQHNWWGTTNPTIINQRIFDFLDDYNIGQVQYMPVAAGPVQTAPAYVRAVTVTPNPVGIETATFDVLFSREMDTSNNPAIEFYTTRKGTWQVYNISNSGLANNEVQAVAVDVARNKWFGTWGSGVSVLHTDGSWQTYNTSNSGLAHNSVIAIAVDTEGNKWFGTSDGGASVLRADDTWQTYDTTNSGLAGNEVRAIAIDAIGNKWFGTYSYGVSVLRADETWQTYNTSNSGLASDWINAAVVDAEGNKWFGTTGGGVSVLHADDTWQIYDPSNSGLPNNGAFAIALDEQGGKWFGHGPDGVSVLKANGTWQIYNTSNSGLASDYVWDITIDAQDNKWIGTWYGGASILDAHGFWHTYNTSNSGLASDNVKAIAVDVTGDKWFGTQGGGVSVLWGGTPYSIVDNPQWLASNLYRATYDFSTLIPRDTYTITISGARMPETSGSGTAIFPIPGGGMEIAPNSAYTFTVDYAGYINDTTAPPAPSVVACASSTPDTLTAYWSAYDPESAIDRYQYAIGVASGGAEVVNWTFTTLTATTRISLSLAAGQTYYVSVKARNEGGIWSEASSVGVVAGSGTCAGTEPASPQVDFFAAPRSGDAPLEVHFTSIVTGAVTSYAWAFGDGGTATTAHPTYTYQSAGSFGVTLVVTGPGGTAQKIKPDYIAVNPPPGAPTATFSADVVSGTAPLSVTFTAVTSGTVEDWHWDLGDSTQVFTGPVVQHTYTITGVFDVSLTVSNAHGSFTVNRPGYITVLEPTTTPVANFTASPLAGQPPLTVIFTDTSTGPIDAWQWDFGGGNVSAARHPTHTYTLTGAFTVSLTVMGPGGSDTEVKTDYIRVSQSPIIASFSGAPRSGSRPLTVHFTDESAGEITGWLWSFGDTFTSTQQNPVHIYTQAETYTVSLHVSGPSGNDSLTRPSYITVTGAPGNVIYLPVILKNYP